MKKYFLLLLLFLAGTKGFCATWTITNSEFTFNPANRTITLGDDVLFTLGAIHNAVEVSQATWDSNGNTPLAGGFETDFGGGAVAASELGVGTHYYVCSPHASGGMKGVIIVQSVTGIVENKSQSDLTVYPNPSNNIIVIKGSSNIIGSHYYMTDQTGRQIIKDKLVSEINPIDISQLQPGIYLVHIVGQRKQSVKVIKK